jgi:ATP-dependent helicase/nuclease subunit A
MTRAGDELLVSRTVARNGAAPAASWWRRVEAALPTWQPPVAPAAGPGGAWATVEVPELPALQARRAAGGAPAPAAAQAPADDPAAAALGSAVHRVLEWLAGRPADAARREHAARAAVHACGLAEGKVADVLRLAGSVLDSPQCARFFDPQAFAWAGNEVPVVAAGAPGRIDRLVAFDEEGHRTWWVLDYKLARAPEALEAHRGQLARYAAAVAALQPGDRVRTAFVAAGGRVVEVTT